MRKEVITAFMVAASLSMVPVAYAHCLSVGSDLSQCTNSDAVRKFQKETMPLRDELITKKLELRKEFSKEKPNTQRIDRLQKEMVDIRTRILKKADETGVAIGRGGKVACSRVSGKCIM